MKNLSLILLIDDNDADNEFHKIMIMQSGVTAKVKNITSSRSALEYLRYCLAYKNDPQIPIPDLIFLDINMPAMDGFELLDKFREITDPYNQKKNIKVFMLSGSLNPDDCKKAKEEYGDLIREFYSKPLSSSIFQNIVNKSF